MIDALKRPLPRLPLFMMFNAAVVGFLMLFIVAPILSHFFGRGDDIAETAAQLSHFESINQQARSLVGKTERADDPFLPAGEERVVSADLQTSLKTMAESAGVRLLSIRAAPAGRPQQVAMVGVNLALEGSMPAIRNMIQTIEGRTPLLFVTSALLRNVSEADDDLLRAELVVQGATRGQKSSSVTSEIPAR